MENKTLYKKLLAVQKEIGSVKKDKTNPFFKSSYADINNYIDEVKPVLNKHGLIIVQPLRTNERGENEIETTIIDSENGEVLNSFVRLPDNPDPQKMGSIITYFRRYAIQSMLFLQAKDDDAEMVRDSKAVEAYPKIKIQPKVKEPIINEDGEEVPF